MLCVDAPTSRAEPGPHNHCVLMSNRLRGHRAPIIGASGLTWHPSEHPAGMCIHTLVCELSTLGCKIGGMAGTRRATNSWKTARVVVEDHTPESSGIMPKDVTTC